MKTPSRPPAAHQQFVARFSRLGKAWDLVNEEGGTGPLDWPNYEALSSLFRTNVPSKCFPVPDAEIDTNPNF